MMLRQSNDAIVIVVGDVEGCHLPLSINLVLQKEKWWKLLANTPQKESRVFVCPLFYGALVQILQNFSCSPVLRSQTRSKMRCGFVVLMKTSSKSMVFSNHQKKNDWPAAFLFSCWSFVSLHIGFKIYWCAIALSNRSKTSQDASKDHYPAFPSKKRRCCVEFGNVR
jgi:hypothetical protein